MAPIPQRPKQLVPLASRRARCAGIVRRLVMVLICLPALACATAKVYSGPERPQSEIAVIETDTFTDAVAITSVDRHVLEQSFGNALGYPSKISVLPGRHTLTIRYSRGPGILFGLVNELVCKTFEIDVEAGATYLLTRDGELTEETSGHKVAAKLLTEDATAIFDEPRCL